MYATGPGTAQRPLRRAGRARATAAGLLPAGGKEWTGGVRNGGRAERTAAQPEPPPQVDEVSRAGGRGARRPLDLLPAERRRPPVFRQPPLLPGDALLLL